MYRSFCNTLALGEVRNPDGTGAEAGCRLSRGGGLFVPDVNDAFPHTCGVPAPHGDAFAVGRESLADGVVEGEPIPPGRVREIARCIESQDLFSPRGDWLELQVLEIKAEICRG